MGRRGVWVRWLEVLGAVFVAIGLYFAIAGGTGAFGPLKGLVDSVFWNSDGPSPATQDFQMWIYAVLGGTMAGWGVTLFALARFGLGGGHRWAWWTLVVAAAVWFAPDTTASAIAGAWFNVIGNAAILVAVAVPLIGLKGLRRG